jgi:hypothetical protein
MTPISDGPSLDLPRLIEVLNRHEVEYLLVGGVAATAYGAERETEDADCVVRRERVNLERLAAALRELHARLRIARMSDDEAKQLKVQLDGVMLENSGNSTWTTDAGPFDVLVDLKDSSGRSVPYEELITRSTVLRGDGFVLHVASLDDVIAAKTFANREKDREALPELLGLQQRPGIGEDQATQPSSEIEIPGPTLEL